MNSKIKILKTEPNSTSKYIQPLSVFFLEDGKERKWDYIKTYNSVAALLYHTEKKAFLLVKQFRPSVYIQHQNDTDGVTYEMCAGLMDKDKSAEDTIREEIFEECGYEVANVEKIASFYSVGFAGSKQTFYFAQIDESMKKGSGGGINDEQIELFFLDINEAEKFLYDDTKPKTAGTMFAIMWFLRRNLNR